MIAPVLMAAPAAAQQTVEPRVAALEEQLRKLTGRIEELNFLVLQMQDRIDRMQQDNEFRFQQLEGGNAGTSGSSQGGAEGTDTRSAAPDSGTPQHAENGAAAQDVATAEPLSSGDAVLGAPPRTFGTITFDAQGNVVHAAPGEPVDLLNGSGVDSNPTAGTTVAALPQTNDPDTLYRDAYQFILSGDYKMAETGFREHIKRFPHNERAADANFWLGEALLGQDRYREAAEVFLRANREYPSAKKAPDMLLKLGISLAAMNQRDVACATYAEIDQRYPDISPALSERIKQEKALAGC